MSRRGLRISRKKMMREGAAFLFFTGRSGLLRDDERVAEPQAVVKGFHLKARGLKALHELT